MLKYFAGVVLLTAAWLPAQTTRPSGCVTGPPSPIEMCYNSPRRTISWNANYCGTPPDNTNRECQRNGPTIVWGPNNNNDNTSEIGNYQRPGLYTVTSPEAKARFTFTPLPGQTVVCPGDVDQSLGTGSVQVVAYGLKQFNAKTERFPKCPNDTISRDDFVIVTEPAGYEQRVVITGLTTEVSRPGRNNLTATATLCDETKNAPYVVLGDLVTEECEPINPITRNTTFAGLVDDLTLISSTDTVTYYFERKRSGTISGTSVPTPAGTASAWSDCGGSIATAQMSGWQRGGQVGVIYKAVDSAWSVSAQFNFSWTGSTTYSYGHGASANKKFQQKVYSHPITLTTSGTNTHIRYCSITPYAGVLCDPWIVDGTPFSENSRGELPPEVILCQRCCVPTAP